MEQTLISNGISICKTDDAAVYLPLIDRTEAEAEFYQHVSANAECIHTVCCEGKTVGLVCLLFGSEGYFYLYIFAEHRRKGYGCLAALAAEQLLRSSAAKVIETGYDASHTAAARLAQKCGYVKEYAAAYMEYTGEAFDNLSPCIRLYRDEDFEDAFTMSAEAFHRMRLSTGCFPDSIPAQATEAARKEWAASAHKRYVYVLNDEIAGFARAKGTELDSVSVKIGHQGKGIGRAMVQFLVNVILAQSTARPSLYCVVGNRNARKLYETLGFEEIRTFEYAKKTL